MHDFTIFNMTNISVRQFKTIFDRSIQEAVQSLQYMNHFKIYNFKITVDLQIDTKKAQLMINHFSPQDEFMIINGFVHGLQTVEQWLNCHVLTPK